MANCVIHPIPVFEGRGDRSTMTYMANFGVEATVIGYIWYIEGLKEKVLVDAGCDVSRFRSKSIKARQIQTLDAGLSKFGLSPDDIDTLIITHLHHDHIGWIDRFPKARILVQKDELEFAKNPHPAVAFMYHKEQFEGIKFDVLNGDTKIYQEISVLSTPGHTPGTQSVSIKTAKGIAIIAGFCSFRENFEVPPVETTNMLGTRELRPILTPGEHVNLFQAHDSVVRVKEMADIVIPLHDPEFLQKDSIP